VTKEEKFVGVEASEEAADQELFARRREALPAPNVPDLEAVLFQADAVEARPAFHAMKARWVDRVQVWGPAAALAACFVGAIAPRGELRRDAPVREEGSSPPSFVVLSSSHSEVCSADEDLGLPVCTLPATGEMAQAQPVAAVAMVSEQDPLGQPAATDSPGCARETSCILPR
jgi:hypothetical protein